MTAGKQVFTNGFSQIMLQSNSWTGLLFLAGIAVNSLVMLVAAIAGSLAGHFSGWVLGAHRAHLQQGLYGYNGALIGLAVAFFWPLNLSIIGFMLVAAVLSSVLMKLVLEHSSVPALTAPFVLLTWLLIWMNEPSMVVQIPEPELGIGGVFLGFGQVMFQENSLSGALFIAGLAAVSVRILLWAVIAVSLSIATAVLLDFPQSLTLTGIYSYNAILAVLALVGRGGIPPLIISASAILTVLITGLLQYIDLPPLTAPFVIVTWLILLVMHRYRAMIWLRS